MANIENGIEVFMIWGSELVDPTATWLVESWDEFSIEANYDGWEEAISKAKHQNEIVRITTTTVDYAAVQRAFEPTAIENSGIKESN